MWITSNKNELINLDQVACIRKVQVGEVSNPIFRIVGYTSGNTQVYIYECKDEKKTDKELKKIKEMLFGNNG